MVANARIFSLHFNIERVTGLSEVTTCSFLVVLKMFELLVVISKESLLKIAWKRLLRLDLFVKGTEKNKVLTDNCSLTLTS